MEESLVPPGIQWDERDGPAPPAEWTSRYDEYCERKLKLLSQRKYLPFTSSGGVVSHVRVVNVEAWNAFWEGYATEHLADAIEEFESQQSLYLTSPEVDPAAVRRVRLTTYGTDPLIRSAMIQSCCEFGSVEWVAEGTRDIVVQFTTPQQCAEACSSIETEGVEVRGTNHRVHITKELRLQSDVSSQRLCLGFDISISEAHLEAVLGMVLVHNNGGGGGGRRVQITRVEGKEASSYMVSFPTVEEARLALHVLQRPFLWEWELRLTYTKDLPCQMKFPLEQ
eukprot:PhF_6_TR12289/c0_g1_i1/m.19507